MSSKKNKVVIFGGAGFLGSHVADALIAKGYDVVIYDLQKPHDFNKGCKLIEGDILDEQKVGEAVQDARFVYNFAGIADIYECLGDVPKAIRCNVLGHTNILEQCRRYQVERVLFSSSIYVYGRHGSFYKITKQACEHLNEEYAEKFGLPFTILRFGSLYGPRAQGWNGVYRFIHQALKEGKIDYLGEGSEKREYIHVLDAARLSVDVLDEKYKNQCIVITGNYILSSRDLLTMINEMLDNKIQVNYEKKHVPDHYTITPHSFIPRIGIKLTPNPSIDMAEGILRQIEEIYKEIKK
jgi:UDP-glucose 4-epimerase